MGSMKFQIYLFAFAQVYAFTTYLSFAPQLEKTNTISAQL